MQQPVSPIHWLSFQDDEITAEHVVIYSAAFDVIFSTPLDILNVAFTVGAPTSLYFCSFFTLGAAELFYLIGQGEFVFNGDGEALWFWVGLVLSILVCMCNCGVIAVAMGESEGSPLELIGIE